jgi:hypothetical protein
MHKRAPAGAIGVEDALPRPPGAPRGPAPRARSVRRGFNYAVNIHLAGDLVTALLAARVLGADAHHLLRRLAAAGVRLGASELDARSHGRARQGERR